MFDKLIVSDATGADFKPRRNYFMVSSLVVGVLFLAAVVVSIFASDYGLGTSGFELAELIPPMDMAAAEPEPPRPRTPPTPSHSTSQLPTRQVIMSRTDEPTIVPTHLVTPVRSGLLRIWHIRYVLWNDWILIQICHVDLTGRQLTGRMRWR